MAGLIGAIVGIAAVGIVGVIVGVTVGTVVGVTVLVGSGEFSGCFVLQVARIKSRKIYIIKILFFFIFSSP